MAGQEDLTVPLKRGDQVAGKVDLGEITGRFSLLSQQRHYPNYSFLDEMSLRGSSGAAVERSLARAGVGKVCQVRLTAISGRRA